MKNSEMKVKTLHSVNDAEVFFVVTDKNFALGGDHGTLVASIAAAIVADDNVYSVISDAISHVMAVKNSQKKEKS